MCVCVCVCLFILYMCVKNMSGLLFKNHESLDSSNMYDICIKFQYVKICSYAKHLLFAFRY